MRHIKHVIKYCLLLSTLLCWHLDIVSAATTEVEVLTFGDSIAAGLKRATGGSISCPSGVALEPPLFSGFEGLVCNGNGAEGVGGFQPYLKTNIQELGYEVSVYNFGYSGLLTSQMVSLADSFFSMQPDSDYALIMGGANDAFLGVSASTVNFNVKSMATTACNKSMVPVISSVTRRISGNGSINNTVISYNNLINAISNPTACSNKNIELIKADQYTATIDGFNFSDGLHLTTTGNINMAEEWFNVLALPQIKSVIMPPIYLLLDD